MHKQMTRRKKWLVLQVVLIVLAVLLAISIGVGIYFAYLWKTGNELNEDMFAQAEEPPPLFQREGEEPPEPDPGAELIGRHTISHNGKRYALQEGFITILFLGVDATDDTQYASLGLTAHQTDVMILVKIDVDTREMTFINIPRNTITAVKQLDPNFNYARTTQSPICIQHAFGDGGKLSCELTVEAVQNLLFNIPISNYTSMNLDGMVKTNDAFGGVTLTLLDDFTSVNPKMIKGAEYTLLGQDALTYIRGRRLPGMDGSNLSRMKRQTQYYKAFFNAAKGKLKSDPFFALELYSKMQNSVHTDLTLNEMIYLVKQISTMDINDDAIHTLPGEADPENDDFHVDDEALKDVLVEVFFEEVT